MRRALLLLVIIATARCGRAPAPNAPSQARPPIASGPVPLLPEDFAHVAGRYEAIRVALSAGTLQPAAEEARWLAISAKSRDNMLERDARGLSTADARTAMTLQGEIGAAATRIAKAPDLDAARAAFADLTKPMIAWRNRTSGSLPAIACCAKTGACWLQPAGAPHGNPYDPAATDCDAAP